MKKTLKDFLYGVYAGLAIALGGFLNIIAKSLLNGLLDNKLVTLIGSLLFPIGLTLVCFLALNLFTGKIGYLFDNKKNYTLFLLIIYLGNIVGSLIAGLSLYLIFNKIDTVFNVATSIASKKTSCFIDFTSSIKMLAGSVLCGSLVYIAVFAYKTFNKTLLKIIGIFIPIAIFVYFGFDHCVANMFYFTFSFSFANPLSYLNIALATLGNSLGAIALNELIKIIKKVSTK